MILFEVWEDPDGAISLQPAAQVAESQARGRIAAGARLRYRFEAATWEEANAIHHSRQGWAPYRPQGEAAPCPDCGATHYPEGSGQCWSCGRGTRIEHTT